VVLGNLLPLALRPLRVAEEYAMLDVMSGGRLVAGFAVGGGHEMWNYNVSPSVAREQFWEAVDLIDRAWTEYGPFSFDGKHYPLRYVNPWPKPLQQPRPPIIVGGSAKPRTVRAAVRFADEYNTVFASVDEARERKRAIDEAARAAGREPLRFSLMTGCVVGRDEREVAARLAQFRAISGSDAPPVAGTVDQVVEQLRAYEQAGVERVMLQHLAHEDVEMVGVLGDVAESLG
jgi:alkanesulfonate monooxygenase SsuD/methylene tetrahydromethanopterin reductase-like flavin-dependent oxidoreductase (luciferase family)